MYHTTVAKETYEQVQYYWLPTYLIMLQNACYLSLIWLIMNTYTSVMTRSRISRLIIRHIIEIVYRIFKYSICLCENPCLYTSYTKSEIVPTYVRKYGTAHIQVYKKHVWCFMPQEILKIIHVLGSCNTACKQILMSRKYSWVNPVMHLVLMSNHWQVMSKTCHALSTHK